MDIACGRSSAPMPQRVTEEGKQDDEEKPQPSGTTAVEQGEAETMEPDATEHHQDTQPLDAQSQVNSVDANIRNCGQNSMKPGKTFHQKILSMTINCLLHHVVNLLTELATRTIRNG